MKKIVIPFSVFFLNIPALAGMGLVQTNFWQAPYPQEYELKVKNISQELKESCQHIDKIAWDEEGATSIWKADQMIRLRSAPLPSQNEDQFQVDFKIVNMRGLNLLSPAQAKEASELVAVAASADALPDFSQAPFEVDLASSMLSNFNFKYQSRSLSKVSESFSLPRLPITLIQDKTDFYLRVISKDVACDLISHRMSLGAKSSAQVKISLESQIRLNDFYTRVESISKSVLVSQKNPSVRAALLGFRLGGYLSSRPGMTLSTSEAQLLALMDKFFFIEKMDTNDRWTESNGQKFLSVSGQSSAVEIQVNLTVEE